MAMAAKSHFLPDGVVGDPARFADILDIRDGMA
jgi:hypothetical protein